jgi:hypothetical protein
MRGEYFKSALPHNNLALSDSIFILAVLRHNLRLMALIATPHTTHHASVLDWQGLPWVVHEAYATPHGFEVYRGYPGRVPPSPLKIKWMLTKPLADYLRSVRTKDTVGLPFTRQIVFDMRKMMGLSPTRKPRNLNYNWTTDKVALLGTVSDHALAKRWGLWAGLVRAKRVSLDIATFRVWDDAKVALLGKHTDIEVARMLGMAYQGVRSRRKDKKIASFTQQQREAKAQVAARMHAK